MVDVKLLAASLRASCRLARIPNDKIDSMVELGFNTFSYGIDHTICLLEEIKSKAPDMEDDSELFKQATLIIKEALEYIIVSLYEDIDSIGNNNNADK